MNLNIRGLLTVLTYVLVTAGLTFTTGCASDSYAAKGATQGATTGAMAGAVGGMISALVFGGDGEVGTEADAEKLVHQALQELGEIRVEYGLPASCPN